MVDSNWIILDRDGVINEDSPDYIKSVDEWQAIPGSIEAINALKNAGYNIAVLTNQAGIGRGLFDLEDLQAMHEKMQQLVTENSAPIDAIFYCPHPPETHCHCRKPGTGMLEALEVEFSTKVEGSYFVGDSLKDLQAAQKKRCHPVLVLSGKGIQTKEAINGSPLFSHVAVHKNLLDFVRKLLLGKET